MLHCRKSTTPAPIPHLGYREVACCFGAPYPAFGISPPNGGRAVPSVRPVTGKVHPPGVALTFVRVRHGHIPPLQPADAPRQEKRGCVPWDLINNSEPGKGDNTPRSAAGAPTYPRGTAGWRREPHGHPHKVAARREEARIEDTRPAAPPTVVERAYNLRGICMLYLTHNPPLLQSESHVNPEPPREARGPLVGRSSMR